MSDEQAIGDLLDRYEAAARAGDAQGCADCYAEDMEYVTAGMAPLRGRKAMADLHAELFESGFDVKEIETHETIVSGDLAYVRQTLTSAFVLCFRNSQIVL